jgi:hypothetical protein
MMISLSLASVVGAAFHYRLQQADLRADAVERLRDFRGSVVYERASTRKTAEGSPHPLSEWFVNQLGIDFFYDVESVCMGTKPTFSDDDFAATCRLRKLQSLRLGRTLVTDDGLQPISQLHALTRFSIRGPSIGDRGIEHLITLKNLEVLLLDDTNLTDAGLAKLAALPNLKSLRVSKTRITAEGVAKLQQALPQCKIDAR